jgi:pimeloyl-ACP methyl ester carboxylesterase
MVRLEDGTELNVVRAGDPDAAITVVLAHGYALDHRSWHKVVDQLAQEFQVITYDHGRCHQGVGDDRAAR